MPRIGGKLRDSPLDTPVDDPATLSPGPAADVGAGDFTIEFWMKAAAAENTAGPVACGANTAWITIALAPLTPARDPVWLGEILRCCVASGGDRW